MISAIYFMEFFDRDQIFCLIDVVDNLKGNILEGKWIAFKVSLDGKKRHLWATHDKSEEIVENLMGQKKRRDLKKLLLILS